MAEASRELDGRNLNNVASTRWLRANIWIRQSQNECVKLLSILAAMTINDGLSHSAAADMYLPSYGQ